MRIDSGEQSNEPLDARMLDLLVPENVDRSRIAHELCAVLELDTSETSASCFEVFARRRSMASEQWSEIADAIAVLDTFAVGIAYGYQLAVARIAKAGGELLADRDEA